MIEYNLLGEYSSLLVIAAILVSFIRDYEPRSLRYKFLKAMYYSAFISVFITISATHATGIYAGYLPSSISYTLMMLYFILLPSVSLTFILYSISLTKFQENEKKILNKLIPYCIPYFIYILVVLSNVFTDNIFTLNSDGIYTRETLYQLPYVIMVFHAFTLLSITIKNLNTIYREITQVLTFTFVFSSSVAILQFFIPETLFTGIAHTLSVLIVHLYIQNVRKSADHLTGIANRISLTHKLNERIRKNDEFSLYIFSLRNFKNINERYGLEIGDKILQYVVRILTREFSMNSVFRYSGDEFALLSKNTTDEYFNKVKTSIDFLYQPFLIDGNDIILDLVFTRVDFPLFGENANSLISAADYSIRTLKENISDNNYLYDVSITKTISEQYDMTQKIKSAISNNNFIVHYQPIYSVNEDKFTQAEALVRMKSDDGTILYPNSFIDLAESTGLITHITYCVLDVVCRDLRHLMDTEKLPTGFESVSINFPYFQFSNPHMVDKVLSILNKHSIPTSMIKIEITERTLIFENAHTHKTILKLINKGFIFELDDFGIDYSNMNVILNLPLDVVKIDRSLLLSAIKSDENRKFFEYLILGIKATNKHIIVEGIEEEIHKDLCINANCDFLQGYLFSKPLPLNEFSKIINI